MQKLAEVCIQRPVFAVMLIMALVVVGGVSYAKLGADRFPNVDLPIITVRTSLFGASPEEIESTITRRIEDAVATVEGIDNIRATSTESTSPQDKDNDFSRFNDRVDIRRTACGPGIQLANLSGLNVLHLTAPTSIACARTSR